MKLSVVPFFHRATGTVSYIVAEHTRQNAVIIDSVLDFDCASGEVAANLADDQLAYLKENNLTLLWILDTHIHADHLSAASYIAQKTRAKSAIGKGVIQTQQQFKLMFPDLMPQAEQQFDELLVDGQKLPFGDTEIVVMSTPGHTADSVSYLIDDNVFVGDTLFMPDSGTARCDFPGGDAATLFTSIQRIHALKDTTKIWVCHDYQPNDRKLQTKTTVKLSKHNIHLQNSASEQDFVKLRNKRDATLPVPKLLYPSLQVNLRGGKLPDANENGQRYFSIPISNLTQ